MAHQFGIPIGSGTIERRGKNCWRVRFNLGKNPETGRYEYSPSRTVHGSKTDARRAAEEYKAELIEAAAGPGPSMTVADYVDRWQRARRASTDVKDATCIRDEPTLRRIKRYFGTVPIGELGVSQIREAYTAALSAGELTPHQYHTVHQKLRQVLDAAVAEEIIPANPAANKSIRAPRPECASRKSLSRDEARRLSVCPHDPAEESRFTAIVIGLATGARRGEVLGLQWRHVHVGGAPGTSSIDFFQQLAKKARGYEAPKARSARTVSIDDETASRLEQWRARQATFLESIGIEQTDETPVIIDSEGGAHDPDNYYTWFIHFCDRNDFGGFYDDEGNRVPPPRLNEHGFPIDDDGRPYSRSNKKPRIKRHYKGLRYHELRHTNISLMIANGVDVRTASKRAGHAKTSTTLDIYSHAFAANDRAAANIIGDILG